MATIELGGSRRGVTLIDDAVVPLVSGIHWHLGAVGYVRGRVNGEVELMHRLILKRMGLLRRGQVTDHINGNKLDNRLTNLRACTQRQNARNVPMKRSNTSGVVGVSWDRTRQKWLAHIKVSRKFINLGWYERIEAAAAARAIAEKRYFGEFAYGANPRAEVVIEPLLAQQEPLL